MYTGATFTSNFTLVTEAPNITLSHHEYMNWRFGEVVFSEATPESAFTLSAWVAHYPFNDATASRFTSSSIPLNRVWGLNQNSVKYLGLDMYSDSNARQRSNACQADATTACQAQVPGFLLGSVGDVFFKTSRSIVFNILFFRCE